MKFSITNHLWVIFVNWIFIDRPILIFYNVDWFIFYYVTLTFPYRYFLKRMQIELPATNISHLPTAPKIITFTQSGLRVVRKVYVYDTAEI